MQIIGPETYKLVPAGKGFKVSNLDDTDRLGKIATSTMPKIYVVSIDKWPVYVGATKQRLQTRIGMKPVEGSWYRGYQFADEGNGLQLHVWAHSNAEDRDHINAETVEAEVVYLIRQAGDWPRYQTEIHFHSSNPIHRQAAQDIMAHFENGLPSRRARLSSSAESIS